MDYLREEPLAAGLLTALVSSVAPTPTSPPFAASLTSAQNASSTSDPGNGDGGGGSLHEWSSLIGIITALAGNVLISLALNIQRYAHIRIGRELEHDKQQQELDWKRANPGRGNSGSYGAVSEHDQQNGHRGRDHFKRFGRYRDESPDAPYHDQPHIDLGPDDEMPDNASDTHDRMRESVSSDRTVRPGEKDLRRKSYLRSPYWWVGIVLMCLGEVGNFMAYGFAPASIVSPLGVVALISNCVIAPFMLKEKFRKRDFWGVIVSIAGAVVVVLSAKSSEEKIGPHDIWVMITRWEFELYLGLTAALIVGLMWSSGKYGSRSILIDVGLVALFGGYTALSTKGVSSLLSFTLWHVITFPITYLLVLVLVFSALMQIRYINRALQRFDSTQVIPTQFVLFTLSVIIGSAVLYRDFESYTVTRAAKFVGGCLLTFLGVYFITSGRVRSDDESSYSAEDEEEAIGLFEGERYRDQVDMSPPARHTRVHETGQKVPEEHDDELQSPAGSFTSRGIEGLDEGQSPVGSLTVESPQASPAPSPFHSESLLTNPWADVQRPGIDTHRSEPQIPRPSTPEQSGSTVLLRFPPAPGAEDQAPPKTASPADPEQPKTQNTLIPQTPPARRLRNSISSRFSPGPLLPTISAGFSAVVAESLRRGETSPVKERKPRRRERGKHLSTTVLDGFLRSRDSDPRAPDPDAATNDQPGPADGAFDPRFALATARLHSTGDLATAPVTTGHSTPGLDGGEIHRPSQGEETASLSRLRSLSDSWSGGLSWLGNTLRRQDGRTPTENHSTAGIQTDSQSQHPHDQASHNDQSHQQDDPSDRV
ncbi:DUF803-domain-containing protein [Aspergillus steynii IBT 23096]|uniref:DUF803-domain-containing protein n=1 Tax=Aspergillus steynii IBT 23096 TaxID=1392250 RepID=A0A2I2FRH6_9EURO|nr:DUF803-domain-containing protein [Aspergillus steynii IBT 23096]PLB43232.1 DUF803-domain-containing protein [Aspergillus steynii IBT 23096]